jgi:hypothetical protein
LKNVAESRGMLYTPPCQKVEVRFTAYQKSTLSTELLFSFCLLLVVAGWWWRFIFNEQCAPTSENLKSLVCEVLFMVAFEIIY